MAVLEVPTFETPRVLIVFAKQRSFLDERCLRIEVIIVMVF
jgi:hypothetical protein